MNNKKQNFMLSAPPRLFLKGKARDKWRLPVHAIILTLQDEERAQCPAPRNVPALEPPDNAADITEDHGSRYNL